MSDWKQQMKDMAARLQQERDELRLKLHLAREDAKDEFEGLEKKLTDLKGRMKSLEDVADDAGENIGAAAKMLAEEIREGYRKIAERF